MGVQSFVSVRDGGRWRVSWQVRDQGGFQSELAQQKQVGYVDKDKEQELLLFIYVANERDGLAIEKENSGRRMRAQPSQASRALKRLRAGL